MASMKFTMGVVAEVAAASKARAEEGTADAVDREERVGGAVGVVAVVMVAIAHAGGEDTGEVTVVDAKLRSKSA